MLTIHLDKVGPDPLYIQLYGAVRDAIERGMLSEGEKLPGKRAWAQHLGVSVMTVEGALRQLEAEGYVEPQPRRGFFVCDAGASSRALKPTRRMDDVVPSSEPIGEPHFSESRKYQQQQKRDLVADFTGATPAQGIFPYSAWARTLRKVLAEESESTLNEAGAAQGSTRLRSAIAAHLRGYRGMEVHPGQVVIGSGAQSLYGTLVQLLGRNRVYAIENPGYPRLQRIYRANDVDVRLVGLDERGPEPEDLHRCGASVLHCMPSHQLPLGITTAAGRRRELLNWAEGGSGGLSRYIIEDDHDCEFRMAGRPVPPLQALDESERVVYANTFTNTLGPAFRIGYLVLPPHLASAFREHLGFYRCSVGALEQLTLARFMESGDYERHLNRQRTLFRKRQDALAKELMAAPCAMQLHLRNVGAGLHFLMEVAVEGEASAIERVIAERASDLGVSLAPLSGYYFAETGPRWPAFIMNFASVAQDRIPIAVQAIAEAVVGAA